MYSPLFSPEIVTVSLLRFSEQNAQISFILCFINYEPLSSFYCSYHVCYYFKEIYELLPSLYFLEQLICQMVIIYNFNQINRLRLEISFWMFYFLQEIEYQFKLLDILASLDQRYR